MAPNLPNNGPVDTSEDFKEEVQKVQEEIKALTQEVDNSATPEGVIRDDELNLKLHVYKGMVVMEFSKPIRQIAFSTRQVRTLVNGLKKGARQAMRMR